MMTKDITTLYTYYEWINGPSKHTTNTTKTTKHTIAEVLQAIDNQDLLSIRRNELLERLNTNFMQTNQLSDERIMNLAKEGWPLLAPTNRGSAQHNGEQ